jgi:uncharacterized protein (TIGR03905 family)
MKKYNYKTQGTCASDILFTIDDENIIQEVKFIRGCDGNAKGVAALSVGRKADEVAELLEGITCGCKSTSCPDQFSKALKDI